VRPFAAGIINKVDGMKTLVITALAALVLAMGSGCASTAYSGGLPTIQFPEERATGEHMNRYIRNWAIDSRQLVDDIDAVLMLDYPSRLSKWNLR
jgi:hypothetical protein